MSRIILFMFYVCLLLFFKNNSEEENNGNEYTKLSVCYNMDTRLLYTVDGEQCENRVALGRFRNAINETG